MTRRFLTTVATAGLLCSLLSCRVPGQEPTRAGDILIGRNGLLRNVHGYDAEGTALVPVRDLSKWLGAQVTYANGEISVISGDTRVGIWPAAATLSVNGTLVQLRESTREFSGVVYAPVTPLCEALGAKVRYVPGCYAGNRPDGADEKWNVIPHLVITREQRQGVILIHRERPDTVAQIVADLEHDAQLDARDEPSWKLGAFGVDWILGVPRTLGEGRFFLSSQPAVWAEPGDPSWGPWAENGPAFCSNAWGLYGKIDGTWRLLEMGQDTGIYHSVVARYSITKSLLKQLGLTEYPDR